VHSVPSLGRLCITETALLNLVWMSLGLLEGFFSSEAITYNADVLRTPLNHQRHDTLCDEYKITASFKTSLFNVISIGRCEILHLKLCSL